MENCELDKEEFHFNIINNVFVCDFFFLEREKDKQHRFTWKLHDSKKNKTSWKLDSYGYRDFRKSLNVSSWRCPDIDKNVKKHMKRTLKEKQNEFQQLSKKTWNTDQILSTKHILTEKRGPHIYITIQTQFSFFSEPVEFRLRDKKAGEWEFVHSYDINGKVFQKVELCYLWKRNKEWFQSFIKYLLSHPNTRLQFLLHA